MTPTTGGAEELVEGVAHRVVVDGAQQRDEGVVAARLPSRDHR